MLTGSSQTDDTHSRNATLFLRVHAERDDGTPLGWMQALVTLEGVRIVRKGG